MSHDPYAALRREAATPLKGVPGVLIGSIAERAVRLMPQLSTAGLMVDLTTVHNALVELDLRNLLIAPEDVFLHDVVGILNHLDRRRVELTQCFVPKHSLSIREQVRQVGAC